MLKKIYSILMIGLVFAVSGCAGALPWNKQNYAGINEVHFKWCENDKTGEFMACDVMIIDAKENGTIDFKFSMPDGTILNFAADDVKAFEGQAIRAGVEQAIVEQFGNVAPEIIDKIMSRIAGVD